MYIARPMTIQMWEVLAHQAGQSQWKLGDAIRFVEEMLKYQRQALAFGERL